MPIKHKIIGITVVTAVLAVSLYSIVTGDFRQNNKPIASAEAVIPKSESLVQAYVTMYSDIETCKQSINCFMANGNPPLVGDAACPRRYKLGTKFSIDGITYTCTDRTAIRYDGRFDLFAGYGMDAYNKAIQHGKQSKEVIVYE